MIPPSIVAPDPLDHRIEALARAIPLAKVSRELDENPRFPREEFRLLGRLRLLGLTIPRRLGGSGLGCVRAGRLLYRLARVGGTAFAKLSLQPEFCTLLGAAGSPALVRRYYRPLLGGRCLVGNQITEPDAGSDVQAIGLSAVREGNRYRLSGTKSQAAFAADADAAIVYGRVGGLRGSGVTAFFVPQGLPGISRTVEPDHGERWMRRGTATYRGVEIPASYRLGPEGAAWSLLREELTHERALLGAIYLGVARASWEEAVTYAGERIAFGAPIAENQAISFPLAEDWVRLDAAWRQVESVLEAIDRGREVAPEAALAKWFAGEVALAAADHAMQVYGGSGYSSRHPLERRLRDLRSARVAHGTAEIARLVGSRALWPRRPSSHRTRGRTG
jgi:alkylation response protein AidB-like acyl-CoA dehydrogenase